MATELFHQLYKKAWVQDCWLLQSLNRLTVKLGVGATTTRAMLAADLHGAGIEFIDRMEELTAKAAKRYTKGSRVHNNTQVTYRCLSCGSAYCDGAVPVRRSGITVVAITPPPAIKDDK